MHEPATITLSFDNGPEPGVTPFVLDVLRARRIRATFFVLGHNTVRGAAGAAVANLELLLRLGRLRLPPQA